MSIKLWASTLALLAGAPMAQAYVPMPGSFDVDGEGWQIVDFLSPNQYLLPGATYSANFQGSGGDPGGYVDFADPSSGSFYFAADANFRGDLSAFLGGKLNYSQKVASPSNSQWRDDPDVVIVSGGEALVYQNAANPASDWTSFSVGLSSNGWHKGNLSGAAVSDAEFQSALGSVSALYLRGEYINGVVETTGLDAVYLSPAAVPEPETYAMLLAGLGVVALARRRRQA